jgi:truncated hemoglobin YjbI
MSLGGARSYDKKNTAALQAAKKEREVISLSPEERKRWLELFKTLAKRQGEEVDKKGLPGSALVKAYNLTS